MGRGPAKFLNGLAGRLIKIDNSSGGVRFQDRVGIHLGKRGLAQNFPLPLFADCDVG